MLIGDHWTVESASVYVYRGKAVPPRKLAGAAIRVTTAGRLRAAGFAVVHTPGDIVNGPHVSIVWPDSNPLDQQTVPWSADVSALFDACFNGVEGDAT